MGCHCAKDRSEDLEPCSSKESLARCEEKLGEDVPLQTQSQTVPLRRRKTVLLTASPTIDPIRRLTKRISDIYAVDSVLQTEGMHTLSEAEFLGTRQKCFLKSEHKASGRHQLQQRTRISAETERLVKLDHPLVLRTYEVMQDDKHFYIATEPYFGGRLQDYITDKKMWTEPFIAKVMHQLLGALSHCHKAEVVHGNINLENIVLMEPPENDNAKIRLTGFGELDSIPRNSKEKAAYAAPEAAQGLTPKCDIWSCGVVFYVLLTGQLPFPEKPGSNRPRRSFNISVLGLEGKGRALLCSMLDRNPENRPTAAQCRANMWFKQFISPPTTKNGAVNSHLFSLRKLHNRNPLQEAVLKFVVLRIVNAKEVEPMTEAFFALDRDEDGVLSEDELKLCFMRVMPEADAKAATKRVIDAAEHNGSNSIGYTEFVISSLGERKLMSPANLRTVFGCFDLDKSGRISLHELRNVFTVRLSSDRERQWRELILQANSMGEDKIDYGEFTAITANFNPNS